MFMVRNREIPMGLAGRFAGCADLVAGRAKSRAGLGNSWAPTFAQASCADSGAGIYSVPMKNQNSSRHILMAMV